MLSGVFEKHPNLKVILGHLGETLPFLMWRIDAALKRPGQKPMSFRDIFCKNFYVTTSGFFSNPALLCCVMEMGVDHILFAVDWPFVPDNHAGDGLDGRHPAVRRGQGEDIERQRQAPVEDVIARGRPGVSFRDDSALHRMLPVIFGVARRLLPLGIVRQAQWRDSISVP